MDLESLQMRYANGDAPGTVALHVLNSCKTKSELKNSFVSFASEDQVKQFSADAEAISPPGRGPLWGACFAVKDNIDVQGFQTTAACPAFSYTAKESAPVVRALLEAGCICIGKTNMDQFAAGLNGTRSPYGVPINSIDARVIPGGSSSGSGVAVGSGAVTFALGTDTAGSGRVPAGLNHVVGIKPTVGMLSTQGVVPACGSIDCVTVFAHNVSDGCTIAMEMATASQYPADHTLRFQQPVPSALAFSPPRDLSAFVFSAPPEDMLDFSGPRGDKYSQLCRSAMAEAVMRVNSLGGVHKDLDFRPLCEVAQMLYGSALVSERYSGISDFLMAHASPELCSGIADIGTDERLLPVTRSIINGAGSYSSVDVFTAQELLRKKVAVCRALMAEAGCTYLMVPTVMHHYLVPELQAQEDDGNVKFNAHLGKFTNFVNLLGLAAVAIPASILPPVHEQGLKEPLKCAFGITLIAVDCRDPESQMSLWALARAFESDSLCSRGS